MGRHYCITGNIGSGKTTVCRLFERLGVPVYYTDTAAKRLMTGDGRLRGEIITYFGAEAYLPDGSLNRAYLANRVFVNATERQRLNALVHPAVQRDGAAWQQRQRAPYTLYETALIYEIGGADRFDGVIVVAAPEAVRRERVMARDGTSGVVFRARTQVQWEDQKKEKLADYIVYNDGGRLLMPQVIGLDRVLGADA